MIEDSMTSELDSRIKQQRRLVREHSLAANAALVLKRQKDYKNSMEQCYENFEILDKLQRQRFKELGSFLPAPDGKVYTYDADWNLWLKWD